jgi:hypothetical protein
MPNTQWSLLGYFKEPRYDQWMEQLFKHEGDCVWTDDEYQFMQQSRDSWPTQCTKAAVTDSSGASLYYDTKPEQDGSMSIGLYQDPWCTQTHNNDKENYSIDDIVYRSCENCGNKSLVEELDTWNKAFDVFKQCQPCKAYDLTGIVAGMNYEREGNGTTRYEYSDNEFKCHADAEYEEVNQCRTFQRNTKMMTATYQDVVLAEQQGTISGALTEYGFRTGKIRREKVFSALGETFTSIVLALSGIYFALSFYFYMNATKKAKKALKVPLTSGYTVKSDASRKKKQQVLVETDEDESIKDLFGVNTDLTG